MSKYINYFSGKAAEMMRNDKDRINLFRKIDEMIELDWSLPSEVEGLKWMRKVISTDPLEAVTVGRRTLATIRPKVFIQPLNDNIVTKRMANWNEQNLLMQLKQANKRAEFDIIGDIVESSLRYGMTAVMTVPVKWQLQGTKSKRWIQNPGGFMVMVENPRNVYPRFSPLGLESVLHVKMMRAEDAISFYGNKARKIKEDLASHATEPNIVIYDYWDFDRRGTWASSLTEMDSIPESVDVAYIIEDTEMELPFLSWKIRKTGTSLSTAEDHRVRPTFAGIAHSKSWELSNIAKTLAFSEALAYAAAPRYKITTVSEDGGPQVEYGDINRPYRKQPHEDIERLDPPTIDRSLLEILDRTTLEMHAIHGIKNLQTLDPPSGTAFATVNELIKAASSALDPAKELAQDTIGGVCEDMLRWSAHTKEDITALGDGKGNALGREYRLKWEHIQPDAIDVEVALTTHVPTDKLQQLNAAILMNKELNFPKSRAYRELDEENPEGLIEDWEQEQFNEAMIQNELKKILAEGDLEVQQIMAGMQVAPEERGVGGMNEESMSQARLANNGFSPHRTGAPRREAQSIAARGLGFNPAGGGLSPNVVNPREFTKEGATGVDRRGNVI